MLSLYFMAGKSDIFVCDWQMITSLAIVVTRWFAAGISDQVKEKPVGVQILGEKVVLYRDGKGVVHCLHDVCPHRGAPLHLG